MTTQPLRLPSHPDACRLKNELPDPAWRYNVGGTFRPDFPTCHVVLVAKQPDAGCHEVTECQLPLAEPHPIGISGAVRQSPSNFVINYPVARILHQFGCHLVRFLFVFAPPARPVIFDCSGFGDCHLGNSNKQPSKHTRGGRATGLSGRCITGSRPRRPAFLYRNSHEYSLDIYYSLIHQLLIKLCRITNLSIEKQCQHRAPARCGGHRSIPDHRARFLCVEDDGDAAVGRHAQAASWCSNLIPVHLTTANHDRRPP